MARRKKTRFSNANSPRLKPVSLRASAQPPKPPATASDGAAKPRAVASEGPKPRFPIVGIGASAGGIEALSQLFKAMPIDIGMGFVVVQHLDPDHASMLAEILSRTTSMPVLEVRDQPQVEPNHVYVIPPGRNMVIESGRLRLFPRPNTRGPHRPVDSFLSSLARDQNHRAIGIILSGTGNDGTFGVEAIKGEGGITFAQDRTAEHDSMPRSAIDSGCVDLVLPPWLIAEELERLGRHPFVVQEDDPGESLGAGSITRILGVLNAATGVDFTHYKSTTLYRRIARRMLLHKLDSLNEYLQRLTDDPAEVQALYRDVLINVTSFFRDPRAFDLLKERVFPRIVAGRGRRDPVRVWVLGCSTGEEAYSLAIVLSEFADQQKRPFAAQVFATDLNEHSIERARAAIYPKTIAQEVTPDRLRRYFVDTDVGYQIVKSIRDMCVFAHHNVLSDPPFSRMDLISCRNVLIYMDPFLQRRIVPVLYYALKPGGCLWLGASETIGTFSDLFDVEDQKHRIYFKAETGSPPSPVLTPATPRWEPAPFVSRRPSPPPAAGDVQRDADRVAIARYAPPGVLINSTLDILQFRGDTSPYLMSAPGKPSVNLLTMAREGLLVGLRSTLQKAQKTGSSVRRDGMRVKSNGGTREIDVQIIPVRGHLAKGEPHWLVQFEEPKRPPPERAKGRNQKSARPVRELEREIARLTEELGSTREYMQTLIDQQEAANEELRSANEEVQSSNEELQSLNEELQTSKEEIQSSNEELTTVNEELRNRNEELGQINDDLTNFLASTHLALVTVSRDLKIRSFTPQAEKLMRLIPGDVGRPIGDMKLPFKMRDLEKALTEVIDSVQSSEEEVLGQNGRWYSLRLRPYRTADNKIAGAVLVLVDVDEQKRLVLALRDADRKKDEFLATLAHELRTPLTSLSLGFEIIERGTGEASAPEQLRERLTPMQRQVQRLTRLVEDLLDVSRIARGTIPLRMEPLELTGLVSRSIDTVRPQLEVDGREIAVAIGERPIFVEGDAVRLEQVVTNLLVNAAKFTDPKGKIRVELTREASPDKTGPELAVVRVRDDGVGIDAELLPHVFEMFIRAPASPQREPQGLGVGLHLVKRLVELHGGTVAASSAGDGRGSEFVIRLPIRSTARFEPKQGDKVDQRPKKSSHVEAKSVLVVDDDLDAASAVAAIFRMCGQNVHVAHSGPDALEAAHSVHPSLIVLDVDLPGMSGLEVARRLREKREFNDVKLVALSGYSLSEDRQRALQAGFDEHLVKPASFEAFERLLESERSSARGKRQAPRA